MTDILGNLVQYGCWCPVSWHGRSSHQAYYCLYTWSMPFSAIRGSHTNMSYFQFQGMLSNMNSFVFLQTGPCEVPPTDDGDVRDNWDNIGLTRHSFLYFSFSRRVVWRMFLDKCGTISDFENQNISGWHSFWVSKVINICMICCTICFVCLL